MARTTVMKLWTAFVTAFLALFTALGLVTTTAAAAVPQTDSASNSGKGATAPVTTPATPAMSPWAWAGARSLPPTMKQRIRAEAHGTSPSCRHRPLADAAPANTDCAPLTDESDASDASSAVPEEAVVTPLQR
ncbi:DUF6344 domain-containing protein [Streptomyces sp. NPDC052687]|uniref:DUF6344 domain-containing protein n=1 Tax=Streptomyces sp. NPDC052687 TaxID=3154759 RepID=UPI003418D4A8